MERTIENLIECVLLEMSESKCCCKYRVDGYRKIYDKFKQYCDDRGILYYQIDISAELVSYYSEVLSNKKTMVSFYRNAIKRLNCDFQNIKMKKKPFGRKPFSYDNSCFNKIRDQYEKRLIETGKQMQDVRSRMLCVLCFLRYLECQGCSSFTESII